MGAQCLRSFVTESIFWGVARPWSRSTPSICIDKIIFLRFSTILCNVDWWLSGWLLRCAFVSQHAFNIRNFWNCFWRNWCSRLLWSASRWSLDSILSTWCVLSLFQSTRRPYLPNERTMALVWKSLKSGQVINQTEIHLKSLLVHFIPWSQYLGNANYETNVVWFPLRLRNIYTLVSIYVWIIHASCTKNWRTINFELCFQWNYLNWPLFATFKRLVQLLLKNFNARDRSHYRIRWWRWIRYLC